MNNEEIDMSGIFANLDAMIAAASDETEFADNEFITEREPAIVIEKPKPVRANHAMIDFPDRHGRGVELCGIEWQAAYEKALSLAESGGIIVAYGKRGTGKTQIAYEVARKAVFANPHFPAVYRDGFSPVQKARPCVYIKAMDIFIDLKNGFGRPDEPSEKQIIAKLVDAAFLVIDEAHVRGETKYEDDKLTHIIDKRYDAMRPTMLITNLEKNEFAAQLSPSIKNRMMECGGGIECNWESFRRKA